MNVPQLRHYSATELVGAGVDLRTVAGRLGHSGGGVTTLRFYTAWLPEADSRAATTLGARLPAPPGLGNVVSAGAVPPVVGMEVIGDYWKPVYHLLEDAVGVLAVHRPAHEDRARRQERRLGRAWIAELIEHCWSGPASCRRRSAAA